MKDEWKIEDWNIEEVTGYKSFTTFYTDFSISEIFGIESIEETYNTCLMNWKTNYKYITELYLAINWKMFRWYHNDTRYYECYLKLFRELEEWCLENFTKEELEYFYKVTD